MNTYLEQYQKLNDSQKSNFKIILGITPDEPIIFSNFNPSDINTAFKKINDLQKENDLNPNIKNDEQSLKPPINDIQNQKNEKEKISNNQSKKRINGANFFMLSRMLINPDYRHVVYDTIKPVSTVDSLMSKEEFKYRKKLSPIKHIVRSALASEILFIVGTLLLIASFAFPPLGIAVTGLVTASLVIIGLSILANIALNFYLKNSKVNLKTEKVEDKGPEFFNVNFDADENDHRNSDKPSVSSKSSSINKEETTEHYMTKNSYNSIFRQLNIDPQKNAEPDYKNRNEPSVSASSSSMGKDHDAEHHTTKKSDDSITKNLETSDLSENVKNNENKKTILSLKR